MCDSFNNHQQKTILKEWFFVDGGSAENWTRVQLMPDITSTKSSLFAAEADLSIHTVNEQNVWIPILN